MNPTRFVLFALAIFPALFAPAAAQSPDPAKLAAIPARMQKFVDDGDLAGAVTVVGRAGGVVQLEAVGFRDLAARDPMAKDTLFRIASMTKPITAVGIMILADEGKLSVDDPVEKHLPEFKGQLLVAARAQDTVTLKKPPRPITLRDLLTHTSGLPGNYPPVFADVYSKRNRTLTETTLVISQRPLDFEPGTKWSYCNTGIDTLGRVIEVASGKSYEAFLAEHVFGPLGMTDTTFYPTAAQVKRVAVLYGKTGDKLTAVPVPFIDFVKDGKFPIPAGGLFSTGADVAKFYRMMLNKGELDGKRILSEKAVAEMTKTQTGDIKTGFVEGMSFGFGFAVVKEPKGVTEMLSAGTFGHGGAFATQSWADPRQDLFAILLIQRTGLPNGDASPMRQELQRLAVAALRQ
ncbi:serine hydrolase domain-containing protein [Fimbriiglobus ruber]|uniref:Beta-lactamase class C n=1 Tax=Fimbriiglobus ruber TaxID=1908690 RepID=A0A225DVI6_9BACT|nr:serine hydrolase domain-containing protein [Fimbriiglobus ruber]OWK45381.1 Beta-lactamase class C [Fimbriiglobus ruber]